MATPELPKKQQRQPQKSPVKASQKLCSKINKPIQFSQLEFDTQKKKLHKILKTILKMIMKKAMDISKPKTKAGSYLKVMVLSDRGVQEHKKKITALVEWFCHTNELRKQLTKAMKIQPLSSLFQRRSLLNSSGIRGRQTISKSTRSSVPYTWEDTPPPHQVEDNLLDYQEHATNYQVSQSNKPSQMVTPCDTPSKRLRSNTKEVTIGTKESPLNSFNFFSVLNWLPKRQDIEGSETQAMKSQDQISSNFSKDMTKMSTTNQATRMATKHNIVISKMNVNFKDEC
ncbi:hypothetical protein DFH28DRAFT_925162 [Melampsora americana]|nr:hypothetical protein DFH28DRAFT_925162 [Melampsora americana]